MNLDERLQAIIQRYKATLGSIDEDARNAKGRSYGGYLRSTKGQLQEYITESLVHTAWAHIDGNHEAVFVTEVLSTGEWGGDFVPKAS